MKRKTPKFMDSPNFVAEPGNWHLKKSATEDEKEAFEEFLKSNITEQDFVPLPIDFEEFDRINASVTEELKSGKSQRHLIKT